MRVLVDLDGIVVDFLRVFLRAYNGKYNDTLRKADIIEWEVSRIVKPLCGVAGVLGILDEDRFFDRLRPLPGAIEGVLQISQELGHEVLIVTAAGSADSARAKLTWVQHYLGWGRRRVIIGDHKHLIDADVLIDDKPLTLRRWKAERPNARAMTIAYPYNRVVADLVDLDAHSYEDTTYAWGEIVKALS